MTIDMRNCLHASYTTIVGRFKFLSVTLIGVLMHQIRNAEVEGTSNAAYDKVSASAHTAAL